MLTSSLSLYYLLSFAIFFNVIALRASSVLVFGIMLLYFSATLLFSFSQIRFRYGILLYGLFLLFLLFIVHVYNLYIYSYNNLYHVQFFGGMQVLFLLFYSLFVDKKTFFIKYYDKILLYFIIIISLSIIIDYIFLHTGHISWQLMYKSEKWAYAERPFGIFGSPSVNSTLLVFFYLLWLDIVKKSFSKEKVLFFLVTAGIVLQGSGSGMFVYMIMLISFMYQNLFFRFFLLPLGFITIWMIIQSNIIQKISLKYILYNYEYNLKLLEEVMLGGFHSIWDVLFGINGYIEAPSDFGPLFFISKVGIVFFIFYSLLLVYMLVKVKKRNFRTAIIVLFIGGLHYPVMFSPIMNVFFPLVILKYIKERK